MKKRKENRPGKTQIFDYLTVLENNDMNQSRTARECGISRGSLRRYHEKYWIEFLKTKEAKKQAILEGLQEEVREKLFPSLVAEINSRLADPDRLKNIPLEVLLSFFGNLVKFARPDLDTGVVGDITGSQFITRTREEIDLSLIQHRDWLNEEEAATYLGVSRKFVYDLRIEGHPRAGTLPYSKLGKRTLIKKTNIDKFVNQLTVKSTI